MNTKNILLKSLAFLFAASTMSAATVEMINGDKLTGTVKSSDEKVLVLETNYGTLNLDKSKVKEVLDEKVEVKAETALVAKEAPKAPAKKEAAKVPQWVQDYRDSVNPYLGGWKLKFKGAFEHKKTNSTYTAYNFSLEGTKKLSELSSIKLNGYYDYTTETPVDGSKYTSTDKYGIGSLYRYDISKETNWYIANELNYRHDSIKQIEHEVNEIITAGYTLKFLNDEMVINIYGGPGIKYIDAVGYDEHWVPIVSVGEEIKWKFHEYMRLEHKMDFQLSLTDTDQYFFYFMVGFAVSPSPLFDIVLRYSYQYDGINASDALKNETRFLLGIEVPLGWD